MAAHSWVNRSEEAILQGEYWRAKEILQGAIRTRPYDQDLYERYGKVLMKMEDLLEAGKYLFLSGKREPAYEKPIAIFLARYARTSPLGLYSAFPRGGRLERRDDYPAPVNAELERLGLPEALPGPRNKFAPVPPGIVTEIWGTGCIASVALVLGLAVLGVIHLVQWLKG